MKTKSTRSISFYCTLSAVFLFQLTIYANGGPKAESNKNNSNSILYTFHIKNSAERCKMIDSATIVFDKYDLTGAGVIVRTVALGPNQEIQLTDMPEGKYYATIYTHGLHREHVSTVINVTRNTKKKNANKIAVRFSEGESYTKGSLLIPSEDTKLFAYIKF
jgi:hypothetical protein